MSVLGNGNGTIISHQNESGFYWDFNFDLDEPRDYYVNIRVPGYIEGATFEYILEESVIIVPIVLGTVIPICVIVSALVSIYYCYRRKLFCFKIQQNTDTPEVSRPVPNYYSNNPTLNTATDNRIDDSNFTEIDLNDGPTESPMTSYIQTVTAR